MVRDSDSTRALVASQSSRSVSTEGVDHGEWQPIETAPMRVFVLAYFGGGKVAAGGSPFATCRRNFSAWYCDDGEQLFADPTHWMSLPQPPAT